MRFSQPSMLILMGFFLVLIGFLLPFLMVLGVFQASFWLSFLSHAASISGLFLGTIGAAMIAVHRRK